MKLSIINRVKYSPFLYSCYYYTGSLFISILNKFIKPGKNKILFLSFGGRKFDDSPKAIYEAMLKDPRFNEMEIVWAFQNPDAFAIPRGRKIKVDTLTYFKELLQSSIWITNSSVMRALRAPIGNRFYLNTWHGTPIKKMGVDINQGNKAFSSKGKESIVNVQLAQSQYDIDIYSKVFILPAERFALTGLPRNDELVNLNKEDVIKEIKLRLGIPCDKKIILYAPTFREYSFDSSGNRIMEIPLDLSKWQARLQKEYFILFRAHYEVAKILGVKDNEFIKNVSAYENLNELMLVSDMLISDYSSIFFDYSILERPMIAYCYDYDLYSKHRGLYFDIREKLQSYFADEDSLIDYIARGDFHTQEECAKKFKKEFIAKAGTASVEALNLIASHLRS